MTHTAVKPLEWQEPGSRYAYKGSFFTEWNARPDRDIYYVIRYVEHNPEAKDGYLLPPYEPYYSNGSSVHFASLDDAKAAAQADYESRIRSALTSPPAPVEAEQSAINVQNPLLILAGIKQFGLASDGADLRDLEAAVIRQQSDKERMDWLEMQRVEVSPPGSRWYDFIARPDGIEDSMRPSNLRAQIDRARADKEKQG